MALIRSDSLYQQLVNVLAAIPSPPTPVLLSDLSALAPSRVIHTLGAAWADSTFVNYTIRSSLNFCHSATATATAFLPSHAFPPARAAAVPLLHPVSIAYKPPSNYPLPHS
ncbi:hypothetical protein DFH29DRAFT_1001037 [Suillus ampliporus]|nr:hypothetical protein DFH29DRAFT_1001037 [Suillus ampliporus]